MENNEEKMMESFSSDYEKSMAFVELVRAVSVSLKASKTQEDYEAFLKENEIKDDTVLEKLHETMVSESMFGGKSILFHGVSLFRHQYGVPIFQEFNLTDQVQLDNISRDVDLVQEELNEFKEAFENKNHIKMIDAIGDLRVVLMQLCISCGLTPDALNLIDFEVSTSNSSKMFRDIDKALDASNEYKAQGVETHIEEPIKGCYVLKRSSDNKVLKNKEDFFEPDFDYLSQIVNFK